MRTFINKYRTIIFAVVVASFVGHWLGANLGPWGIVLAAFFGTLLGLVAGLIDLEREGF